MPTRVKFKVEGIDEIKKRYREFGNRVPSEAKRVLKAHGFNVERKAKDICSTLVYDSPPAKSGYRRTGRLVNSISTNWSESGKEYGRVGAKARTSDGVSQPVAKRGGFIVVAGSGVHYAVYVEFGTRRKKGRKKRDYIMEARPFIFPAYLSEEGEVIKSLDNVLRKEESQA